MLKALPLVLGMKQGCLFITTSIQQCTGSLAIAIRWEKDVKGLGKKVRSKTVITLRWQWR